MKAFLKLALFRGIALIAGLRALAWYFQFETEAVQFLAGNRWISGLGLIFLLIWIHLLWDVEKKNTRLAFELRTKGLIAFLKADRSNPKLPHLDD